MPPLRKTQKKCYFLTLISPDRFSREVISVRNTPMSSRCFFSQDTVHEEQQATEGSVLTLGLSDDNIWGQKGPYRYATQHRCERTRTRTHSGIHRRIYFPGGGKKRKHFFCCPSGLIDLSFIDLKNCQNLVGLLAVFWCRCDYIPVPWEKPPESMDLVLQNPWSSLHFCKIFR